jgi:hypothetical protein
MLAFYLTETLSVHIPESVWFYAAEPGNLLLNGVVDQTTVDEMSIDRMA